MAVIALLAALTARADAGDPIGEDDDETDYIEIPYAAGGSARVDRPPSFDGACDCDAPTLARIAATAPSVASVVERACAAAGLADDPTRGWRRRSRWSALVPYVSVRAGTGQSWRDILDATLAETSSAGSAGSGPITLNRSLSYDVRLAWHLDRLLYDPNEPRFTAFELARRRDRRTLAATASRAYYVWLRASVAVERDARWQLRVAEATAELDALTDRWFSEQLARRESR